MTDSRKTRPTAKSKRSPVARAGEDEERSIFEKLYADWIPLHDRRPSTLYHYTTALGLLGIIQSNRLWASNARFLNDSSEIAYAVDVVREAITWVTKNYPVPLPSDFSNQLGQDLAAFEAEARVYVCCFCSAGDLLSQWRGYGAQGGGYAIGFDTKGLGDREVANPPRPILRRVVYDPETQQRLVRTWLQAVCDVAAAGREAEADARSKLRSRLNALISTFTMLLSEFLICFKNPAYVEEQEWRLIQFGRVDGKEIIKPVFRAAGGRIIAYTTLV
jgi:hypothetical protein